MKLNDLPPTDDDQDWNPDDADSCPSLAAEDQSSFSKMLAKKRQDGQIGDQAQGNIKARRDQPDGTGATSVPSPAPSFVLAPQPTPVEGGHVVALPPELQQLVREISVAVNADGAQQVHIELNSTVLKGLHIRIERQNEGVAIQFQSPSDQVSSLLSKNISLLSQGLSARGVEVSRITVTGSRDAATAQGANRPPAAWGQSRGQGRGR